MRQQLQRRPRIPYERLETTARPLDDKFRAKLDRMLMNGWTLNGSGLKTLAPPIEWTHSNRSFEFRVHAWDPLTHLLAGYEGFGDERYFQAALGFCVDWVSVYQEPLLAQARETALLKAEAHTGSMAWYDMAAGQRVYRLAYVTDVVGRSVKSDDGLFSLLLESVRFHLDLLGRDSFFVGHTNHGLYQALGQMAAARRLWFLEGAEGSYAQAAERLSVMFARSFFESGVHREHSPGYHHMILGTLLGARGSNLLTPAMNQRLELAEEALGWMIGPQGVLATIGDTDLMARSYAPDALTQYHDQHVRHLLSDGRSGSPAPQGIKAYSDAGAVFIRSGGTYLAQSAAFHSRTHKHADHFSFLWWEAGEEILIDPGRFGYLGKTRPDSTEAQQGFWYSDPRRMYVEKTRAHNCVEIDGKDYPRKGARPFGSALCLAEQQDKDLFVTTCETYHFRRVRHRRDLIVRPGHFVLILDWLYDRSGQGHEYKQWFQLAPQWGEVRESASGASFLSPSGATLWVANLLDPVEPVIRRGETFPEMSGWRSDRPESLVPATSFYFAADGQRGAFATLFLLGDGEPTGATRTNGTLSSGRFTWREHGNGHAVSVSRAGGDTRAAFRAAAS